MDIMHQFDLLPKFCADALKKLARVAGKTNKSIGYELGISPKTVDFHRANILSKTGVNSVVELVRLTQKAGRAESKRPA